MIMCTLLAVRRGMRDRLASDEGVPWSVKLDEWDLGGHLDCPFRAEVRLWLLGSLLSFGSGGWLLPCLWITEAN